METQSRDAWNQIEATLRKPFPPGLVRFRLQGPAQQGEGKLRVRVIPVLPIHAVEERLDASVGSQRWTFRCQPVSLVKGKVSAVKGILSLAGLAPKEALGEMRGLESGETPDDEALRRCAAHWGVGRYLTTLELWAEVTSPDPTTWALSPAEVERLRARLPRPEADGETGREVERDARPERKASHAVDLAAGQEPRHAGENADAPSAFSAPEGPSGPGQADGERADLEAPEFEGDVEREDDDVEVLPELDPEEFDEANEGGPDSRAFPEAGSDDTGSEGLEDASADEIPAGEEEEAGPATPAGEPVDPEKLLAIWKLWMELEKEGEPPLEGMTAAAAETTLEDLKQEWGEQQRQKRGNAAEGMSAITPAVAHRPAQPGQSARSANLVTPERFAVLVLLHRLVHGNPPAKNLEANLPASAAEAMIAAKERMLVEKLRKSTATDREALLAQLDPALASKLRGMVTSPVPTR